MVTDFQNTIRNRNFGQICSGKCIVANRCKDAIFRKYDLTKSALVKSKSLNILYSSRQRNRLQ